MVRHCQNAKGVVTELGDQLQELLLAVVQACFQCAALGKCAQGSASTNTHLTTLVLSPSALIGLLFHIRQSTTHRRQLPIKKRSNPAPQHQQSHTGARKIVRA
jgi:hypothetical protein